MVNMLLNSIVLVMTTLVFSQMAFGDIAVLNSDNKSVELFIDYKITYTPAIPDDGLFGVLTLASPIDACSPMQAPPTNISHLSWFVLAYRSSTFHARCSNREKIQHAANAGYKAIILYSPSDFYQNSVTYSPFEHSNISIPAVLVSHEDGETLRIHFQYQSGYRLFITSEMPPNFGYYLIPFAIVIGAGILIIISYLIFQLMMCIMERRKAQRHRLSKKYLKNLTLQKYEKGIFYETCAICLDDYVEGEKIRILPCNHAYHQKCIDPWLTKNRRDCPVCKAKVTLPGMENSDSDSDTADPQTGLSSSERNNSSETTRLLPSSESRLGRNHPYNRLVSARNLRSFSLLIEHSRNENQPPRISRQSTQQQQSQQLQQPSSSRYEVLDDSMFQPGPSTSAPIISELSSSSSRSTRNSKRKKKRSSSSKSQNVQVVVADVSPIIAPPQLSINCVDSESERPITPINGETIPITSTTVTTATEATALSASSNQQARTSSRSRQNRISPDQIV